MLLAYSSYGNPEFPHDEGDSGEQPSSGKPNSLEKAQDYVESKIHLFGETPRDFYKSLDLRTELERKLESFVDQAEEEGWAENGNYTHCYDKLNEAAGCLFIINGSKEISKEVRKSIREMKSLLLAFVED